MDNTITLKALTRSEKTKAKIVRSKGSIPAILYGHKVKNQPLVLGYNDFVKVYREAGENTLISLTIDKAEPVKVLIHDVDHDVVTNNFSHIDLYSVNMKEKIHAEIPIHFNGEAPAVKNLGGSLFKQVETLPVKCLPQDLIKFVETDISKLETFDDAIRVKDIKVPEALEVTRDAEDVIVLVTAPRIEKEEEPEEETPGEGEEAATEESKDESTPANEKKEDSEAKQE